MADFAEVPGGGGGLGAGKKRQQQQRSTGGGGANSLHAGVSSSSAAKVRQNRPVEVKNKQPADVQISAEQLVREARERQQDEHKPPTARITDPEEAAEYRMEKRKHFEDQIRRVRWKADNWIQYALWEEKQGDLERARSVWERALDQNATHVPFWLKYAEMEMRGRNVNHARNVWDRAVSILPRVDKLWYGYVHMEQMLHNIPRAREVFNRWMHWEPDHQAWQSYINFELKCGEIERARDVYAQYVRVHPTVDAYVRYAKFEHKYDKSIDSARAVYEQAVQDLQDDDDIGQLYVHFAEFEEMVGENERARAIYRYAIDSLPKGQAEELLSKLASFERRHGSREGIEDVVTSRKRLEYEEEAKANPLNYDNWFDYARLEESTGNTERVRDVYERAVACLPPANEKRFWQRYIYLWIFYALFEEVDANNIDRARQVYHNALETVPHSHFTFAKLWVYAAKLELRRKDLTSARRVFGTAIAKAPKAKIFRSYIEMEQQLGEMERCRTIYTKFLEHEPHNCAAWAEFAEMERLLGEIERARAIYELAVAQPALDMPESLWRGYIDFEACEGNRRAACDLFERLLERTSHVKVWLSYASFCAKPLPIPEDVSQEQEQQIKHERAQRPEEVQYERTKTARAVYERAERHLREAQPGEKEARLMLLEAWLQLETERGDEQHRKYVEGKMPRRVKRKRTDSEGNEEEYHDYLFPEESGAAQSLKILEAAYNWKKQKQQKQEHHENEQNLPANYGSTIDNDEEVEIS